MLITNIGKFVRMFETQKMFFCADFVEIDLRVNRGKVQYEFRTEQRVRGIAIFWGVPRLILLPALLGV
jgi:hypothetical protein